MTKAEPSERAPEVAARVDIFRRQLDAWVADARIGVPFLALPDVHADGDQCQSCGAPLTPEPVSAKVHARCALCAEAADIALGAKGKPA
jgi:hypothetical protein